MMDGVITMGDIERWLHEGVEFAEREQAELERKRTHNLAVMRERKVCFVGHPILVSSGQKCGYCDFAINGMDDSDELVS